jgi:hypothetical protein
VRQRLSTLASDVKRIEQQIVEVEQELLARQQVWETEQRRTPPPAPATSSDGLVAHYARRRQSGPAAH